MMFDLKNTGELSLTALNIEANVEGKLTFVFKNDIRNLGNFLPEYLKVSKFGLWNSFKSKVENV